MKGSVLTILAAAAVLVASAIPALAHHSFAAEFDTGKAIDFTGVLTKVEWMNPHVYFYVDVKDPQTGKVTNWGCEIAANPYQLILSGWNKERSMEALKPGTSVTVTLAPSRAGTPTGEMMKLFNEKGDELLVTVGGNGPQ